MSHWRMQLHPSDPAQAVAHTTRSLGLGYIGLDFANPPGDLTDVERGAIDATQRDYWDFAHKMTAGDLVLVIAHHYPVALVEVTGVYNYIRRPDEEVGVWFRHLRRVRVLGYYADFRTNPAEWEKNTMTDTIAELTTETGISYQLIERWRKALVA
ncbi:MAG: hypothetical protein H7232_17590 [Aeromicrobium sp.]|nr:hypothetical protein [Burkholderiales bacterium]